MTPTEFTFDDYRREILKRCEEKCAWVRIDREQTDDGEAIRARFSILHSEHDLTVPFDPNNLRHGFMMLWTEIDRLWQAHYDSNN
jgi:hypothetical protein